jgi:predicted ribosome quality control (RQC) complex YloA/Tae2 family protein
MNYDSFVAAAVAAEARESVLRAWVDAVYQPEERLVILGFYGRGGKTRWAFSSDARLPGVYRTERKRPNPAAAPAFCMLLRKYVEGARLAAVETLGFDRILRWQFERSDGVTSLIAEIMGKHSNLILVDEAGEILGAVKAIPAHVSRARQVLPGLPYQPPPGTERRDPRSLDRDTFLAMAAGEELTPRWLMERVAGFGPFAAQEVFARAGLPEGEAIWAALDALMRDVRDARFQPTLLLSPAGSPDGFWAFPSRQRAPEAQRRAATMSAAVEPVYAASESGEAEVTLRRELRAAVRSALERAERQRRRVEEDLTGEARAEGWRIDGELLASNLHKLQRGDKGVEVVDYYDPDQRTRVIPLDAELSPQENVERLFRKHRKAIDAAAAALEQSEEVEGRYEALAALRDRVEHAAPEELPALREEIAARGLLREAAAGGSSSRRREVSEFPPGVRIRRTNVDGWEILYGENATSNDYLTTRVARPDDLWLHVRAAASAHVVIRTGGRADRVPPQVLEQAARAAAAHSESKHAGLVPVDYVLRKHVRKPRRSAPGLVTYQNEKTLFISPETR